jgi:hypothetical protein
MPSIMELFYPPSIFSFLFLESVDIESVDRGPIVFWMQVLYVTHILWLCEPYNYVKFLFIAIDDYEFIILWGLITLEIENII